MKIVSITAVGVVGDFIIECKVSGSGPEVARDCNYRGNADGWRSYPTGDRITGPVREWLTARLIEWQWAQEKKPAPVKGK